MTENRNNLQSYATLFGTYMGGFWILKFIFLPLTFTNSFFGFLFMTLTCAVPFMGYYYVRLYRDKGNNGEISFISAFFFLIFMYMFASLLVAVAHFIYFRFIDNGALFDNIANMYQQFFAIIPPETELNVNPEEFMEAVDSLHSLTPIEITMQFFSRNFMICCIISIITALFVMKRKTPLTKP